MKDLLLLLAHLMATRAKLPRPGEARAIVADGLPGARAHGSVSTGVFRSSSALIKQIRITSVGRLTTAGSISVPQRLEYPFAGHRLLDGSL